MKREKESMQNKKPDSSPDPENPKDLMDLIALPTDAPLNQKIDPEIGVLIGFDNKSKPLVKLSNDRANGPIAAKTTVKLGAREIGRYVVILFESNNAAKPIIMGLLQDDERAESHSNEATELTRDKNNETIDVWVDGKRTKIEAKGELVLLCGSASITLRRNGKVIIRGSYIESRSKGTNRIKGGSVLIN